MRLRLKDILPNPFRDLKANPLVEDKIADLVGSINLTGFWDNVVVRKNAEGKYALAYGHHRLAAAIRAGITEADFIVKNLDDALMIQIMDNENRETYDSTPLSLIESVKAVVKSLAAGTITPFKIDPSTPDRHVCYAPSFVPGKAPSSKLEERRYTAFHVGTFLGRVKNGSTAEPCVVAALNALYLKEKGRFNDSLLVTKDRTGAKVSITTNELLRITKDIKRDVQREEVRVAKTKEEVAEADAEQRRVQAEARARQDAEEKKEKELLEKLAEAEREENAKKVKAIQAKLKAEQEAAEEKVVLDKIRISEIDAKVAATKAKAEAQLEVDNYLPTKREAVRILHKLQGETSTTKEALAEEVKALVRRNPNQQDREQLRQAAMTMGTWYMEWVAMQFLPPLSSKKQMAEYRTREAANRRAEEAKQEKKAAKAKKEKHGKTK